MLGYLDAVDPGQGCSIVLAGAERWVPRARLGLHLRLARLAEQFDTDPQAGLVRDYLALCGIPAHGTGAPQGGTGVELLSAYAALRTLNAWQWELPWMTEPHGPRKPPAYEYPERVWAWWVHKLASRYGWTPDQVFDLWPEEAAAYLQELFVAEFDEAEERRALSELSYKYDKGSQTSRFIPTPRPGWMVGAKEARPVRIRKSMLPLGNVIDLNEIAKIVH